MGGKLAGKEARYLRQAAKKGVSPVQLGTVLCNNQSARGQPCGASAVVHEVHYKYAPELRPRSFEVDRILTEIRYDIDCPRCGFRSQVEKVGETELARANEELRVIGGRR